LGYIVLIRIGENRALMAAFSNTSKNHEDDAPRRVPKPQASPPGGGGKRKTRIGAGDMGGGALPPWQGSGRLEGDSQRSVPHSHLKDMAIDALEMSYSKDQAVISRNLSQALGSFDMQPELAEVLSAMVFAAYSTAQVVTDERALFLAYSCFTDDQLVRIMRLARGA